MKIQVYLITVFSILASCTKIDTTRLGGELIPVVDNINTFDTILEVQSFNYIPEDSTRYFVNDPHPAGGNAIDPLFGSSKATLFFEMKPSVFPFNFGPADSIVGFDSAVLVLSFRGYYGDSAAPVNYKLYEVNRKMQHDTLVRPNYTLNPDLAPNTNKFWGEKSIAPNRYRDTLVIKRGDSVYAKVKNQLRIPLNSILASRLFYQFRDTTNGAFKSDSLFKEYLPGFALQADPAAASLQYFGLQDASSQVTFYYRTKSFGKIDTTSKGFGFTPTSGHAVKFERNRAGAEINNFLNADPQKGASQIYVQTAPYTKVSVKIPGLKTLTNRIIHRAELRVVELTPNNGPQSQLTAPPILYLDVEEKDNNFKGVPYDLTPLTNYFCFPNNVIEFFYFGGPTKTEKINGESLNVYRFNIARHVQGIITRKEQVFNFRLSAPYYMVYSNCYNSNYTVPPNYFFLKNTNGSIPNIPGNGRVRLAGGSYPDVNKRMQLRIIYSKL